MGVSSIVSLRIQPFYTIDQYLFLLKSGAGQSLGGFRRYCTITFNIPLMPASIDLSSTPKIGAWGNAWMGFVV